MKKLVFFSILAMFRILTAHSQDSLNLDDKSRDNQLSQNDWSDIGSSPFVIGKKIKKIKIIPQMNLIIAIGDSIIIGSPRNSSSNSNLAKMPVHKPDGIHNMRVYEIDSTSHFYLRIYKPD